MIYIIITSFYITLFLAMAYGVIRTSSAPQLTQRRCASIVICARNEADNLPALFDSLAQLIYPADQYEIILVDDSSTDETARLMQQFAVKQPNRHYLYHEKTVDSYKGKKGALEFGIEHSQYEFIIATDADCIVPPNWLKSMLPCFNDNVAMVQGYSPVIRRSDFLSVYQQFDTLAEGVTAAASMYFNNPTHANARNFAFRKTVFQSLGGFKKISHVDTGDDFYLAKLIKKESDYRFKYNPDPAAFVFTEEVASLTMYWQQQLRRNSKGVDLGFSYFILGCGLLGFHILLLYLLFSQQLSLFGLLLGGKLFAELLPVSVGVIKFQEKRILPFLPILWIIYPIFYFLSQILGSFKLYKWK